MASTNLNKFVQSNMNLKVPWMLSKKTNELVNNYVQKIYKQVPASFHKATKAVKVATPRVENRGPLSTYKNQLRQLPAATITPRTAAIKRSTSKLKQQKHFIHAIKIGNTNNQQIPSRKTSNVQVTSSKRVLKTPNYKIYKILRYGSSSSSSRSSILKRYDERRRQNQSTPAQVNYLIRSFHTSKFEPTYARYLMPARNQQVESNLGSIPNAIKFTDHLLKDLIKIDKSTANKFAVSDPKKGQTKERPEWNRSTKFNDLKINASKVSAIKHASSYMDHSMRTAKLATEQRDYSRTTKSNDLKISTSRDAAVKNASSYMDHSMRNAKLSPEHREYSRLSLGRASQFKHPRPPNELFTAQHDRKHTELHEKHRRNRMKKLGLIKSPTTSDKDFIGSGDSSNVSIKQTDKPNENTLALQNVVQCVPQLSNQGDIKHLPELLFKLKEGQEINKTSSLVPASPSKPSFTLLKTNEAPAVTATNNNLNATSSTTDFMKGYSTVSPTVAARAEMPNLRPYRYNRFDFFSTKKY